MISGERMKEIKVSVITVVYNDAKGLAATVVSVAQQTCRNIEHVVIDGGSVDGTVDVIHEYAAKIESWVSEPDKGIYDAMNKGAKIANGEYIIFMNAGDIFYDKMVIDKFCLHSLEGRDVYYGDHWVVGSKRSDGYHAARPIDRLDYGMVCSHQSMFFKRSLLMNYPFSLNFGSAGDFEQILRLRKAGASFGKLQGFPVAFYSGGGVSDMKRRESIRRYKDALLSNGHVSLVLWLHVAYQYTRAAAVEAYVRYLK